MSAQSKPKKLFLLTNLWLILVLIFFATFVGLFSQASKHKVEAANSSTINFQARLLTNTGALVPDGYYNVKFNLYTASSGGSTQWTEEYYDSNGVTAGNDNRVRVVNGYLSVYLGSLTSFPTSIDWDQEQYLTLNVGGVTQTATPTYDGEMSPRLKLSAVPYAFKAGQLAKRTGANTSTLDFDTQTAANSILLPDESGTLCIQGSTNCGFAASSGSNSYINNGTSAQTADFNITGDGTIGGDLTSNGSVLFQNSVDSHAALRLQNSTGGNLLVADSIANTLQTADLLPNEAGSLIQHNNSSVTAAGGGADKIVEKVGSDGFARIAYTDNSGTLKYARCTDNDCTNPVVSILDSGASVDGQKSLDMVLGSDGFARISYYDSNSGTLKYARCTDADCTTPTTTTFYADYGESVSLAIGSDGFARIAFTDDDNVLKYVRCTEADCTTAPVITSIDTDGPGQYGSSLAIGSDGFARISYYNNNDNTLKYARCTDNDCTSPAITTVDSGPNDVGAYNSLAIGSDGFVRISYIDWDDSTVEYARCTDNDCTSPAISTVDTQAYRDITSLAIGSDGFARISYDGTDGSDEGAKYARCTDADCTSPAIALINTDGAGMTSLAIGSDGFARISYSNNSLQYARCTDDDCTSPTPTNLINTVRGGNYSSQKLGSDGFARISYSSSEDELYYARCTDAECTSPVVSVVDGSANVDGRTSLAIGSDGFARILYFNYNGSDSDTVKYARCTDADCTSPVITEIDGTGSGIFGDGLSVDIGSDGFARISYGLFDEGSDTGTLQYIRCTDDDCTTPVTATIDSGDGMSSPSMAIGSDGFARVAYTAYDSGTDTNTLKYARCTDADCTSPVSNEIDEPVGSNSSLVLGSDGFARIAYVLQDGGLVYIHCTDDDCGSWNNSTIDSTANAERPAMAIGSDGFARVSYYDDTSGAIEYARCTDDDCDGSISQGVVASEGAINPGSMAIGSDGFARVSYYDDNTQSLIYAVCVNEDCSGFETVAGTNIGSSSNPYGQLYVSRANINGGLVIDTKDRPNSYAIDVQGNETGNKYLRFYDSEAEQNVLTITSDSFTYSPTNNSDQAFQIQRSNGNTVFGVDTDNSRVLINGDIRFGEGDSYNISVAESNGNYDGGDLNIYAGNAGSGVDPTDGGYLTLLGGNSSSGGQGGGVWIQGGYGYDSTGHGGDANILSGDSDGVSGDLHLGTGYAQNGASGDIYLSTGFSSTDDLGSIFFQQDGGTVMSITNNQVIIDLGATFISPIVVTPNVTSGTDLTLSGGTGGSGSTLTPGGSITLTQGSSSYPGGDVILTGGATAPTYDDIPGAEIAVQGAAYSTGSNIMLKLGQHYDSSDTYLQVTDSSGANILQQISSTGATIFQNSSDSTAGFQIQDLAGTSNLLVADTTNTRLGVGTASPNTTLTVYNDSESTTQTDFTQALNKGGINIVTDFTDTAYTPGIFWSTQDNNATKPKAGIYMYEDGSSGTSLLFGTSGAYATGITNTALTLNSKGGAIFKNGTDDAAGFQVKNSSNAGVFTVNTSTGATLTSTLFIDTLGSSGSTSLCLNGSSQVSTCSGGGSGVTTVGAIDGGTYSADGASISGTTIYLQTASATQVGLVNTGTQTFAGAKTFSGQLSANGNINSTGALTIQGGTTLTLQSTTSSAVSLDSGSTGAVNIGTGANAKTITIGNNTGATSVVVDCGTGACSFGTTATAHTTTVGSANGASTTTIQGGTGGVNLGTGGIANTIQIGNTTGAVAQTINVGNNATASSSTAVTIGSTIGASAVTIQGGTGAINIGTQAVADTITIGNGTGATSVVLNSGTGAINIGTNAIAHTTTIGNGTGASSVVLQAGTGAINIGTNAIAHTTTIGNNTGASSVVVDCGTGACSFGTTATAHTTTAGSTNGASATTLQAGTGGLAITTQGTGALSIGNNAVAQTINIGNATGATAVSVLCGTGACGFGNNAVAHTTTLGSVTGAATTTIQGGTGGINLGNDGVANTIQIGNTTSASAQIINIGTNNTASSTNTVNIGSNIGTSPVTIKSGSTGTIVQSNSTTAFQIQNTTPTALFTADTTNTRINVVGDVNVGSRFGNRLFTDNFESGNLNLWDQGITGPITADTSVVHGGKYSAKINPSANNAYATASITPNNTVYARAWVNVTSQTSSNADLLNLVNDNGTASWTVYRNGTTAQLWNDCTSSSVGSGGSFTTNAWHLIEMRISIGAGTGTSQVWFDGTQIINATSQNNCTRPLASLDLGDGGGRTFTAYVDDLSVDTATNGTSSSLNVDDSFHVGGTASFGNSVLVNSVSNSTTAFQVQNASGVTALGVDTKNMTTYLNSGTDTSTLGSQLFTGGTSFPATTGWGSISGTGQSATATHVSGTTALQPSPALAISNGSTYLVSWDIINPNNGGTLSITMGGQTLASYSFDANDSGSYTLSGTGIITASSTANLSFTPNGAFTGRVTNVSVKQLTTNDHPVLTVNNSLGNPVLDVRTSDYTNVSIGLYAGASNLIGTATANVALGALALTNNVTGTGNTAIGHVALQSNVTGSDNTAVGFASLVSNTSGGQNVALGNYTLNNNTIGFQNVAIGANALQMNVDGSDNTAVGQAALFNNTTGYDNVAMGHNALFNNTTGTLNLAIGSQSLLNNTTGSSNTAVGYGALDNTTTGTDNVGFGQDALTSNTTGSSNTALGYFADTIYGGLQNATAIGAGAEVGSNNTIILGHSADGGVNDHVGIGTSYAQNPFEVAPNTYDTGTISQSGGSGTVVGSGTSWNTTMIGATLFYPNGTTGVVTAVANATHLTSSNTTGGWAAGTDYALVWGGFNVNADASLFLQTTTDSSEALNVLDSDGGSVLQVATDGSTAATINQWGGGNLINVTRQTESSFSINNSGEAVFHSLSGDDSHDAFQVQMNNGTVVLNVDTLNGSVNINPVGSGGGRLSFGDYTPSTDEAVWIGEQGSGDSDILQLNGEQGILFTGGSFTSPITVATLTNGGQLQLPITGSSAGIQIGVDTQLYRSASNVISLGSNDSFSVPGGGVTIGGTANSTNALLIQNTSSQSVAQFNNSGNAITFFSGVTGGTFTTDIAGTTTAHGVCHSGAAGAAANVQFVACSGTAGADYAELYPSQPDVVAGDIVMTTTDYATSKDGKYQVPVVAKTNTAYNSSEIGVISEIDPNSDESNLTGHNVNLSDHPMPVALNGRVLTKVSIENGAIEPGDYITASSTPGIGMKATAPGEVIGRALQSYNGTGTGQILTFVNPFYYGGVTATESIQDGGNATITDLVVTGNATLADLDVQGDANVSGNLSVGGDTQLTGNLNVGQGVNVVGDSTLQGNIVLSGTANLQGIVNANQDLNVNNDTKVSGDLRVDGASQLQQVTASSIDLTGNASVNALTASVATIDQITASDAAITNLSVSGTATIGTLHITGNSVFDGLFTINSHIITGKSDAQAELTTEVLDAAGKDTNGDKDGICEIDGNDTSGTITLTTGTQDMTDGSVCKITFIQPFGSTPRTIISAIDKDSLQIGGFVSSNNTDFTLNLTTVPTAHHVYKFNYWNPQ